jgi:hypothetical protein
LDLVAKTSVAPMCYFGLVDKTELSQKCSVLYSK